MMSKGLDLAFDLSRMIIGSHENNALVFFNSLADELGYVFRGKQSGFVEMNTMRTGGCCDHEPPFGLLAAGASIGWSVIFELSVSWTASMKRSGSVVSIAPIYILL